MKSARHFIQILFPMLAISLCAAALGFLVPTRVAPSPAALSVRCSTAPMLCAAPSPPPTVDLRRKRPEETSKYGVDPRPNVGEDGMSAPDKDWLLAHVKDGEVNSLQTAEQLQAALDSRRMVVIKFMREGCAACASTLQSYANLAKRYGSDALFFEVDFDRSRPFCKQCRIKFVPAAHIYTDNVMQGAFPMGKKTWDAFVDTADSFYQGVK